METDLSTPAAYATIALGAAQALTPQLAAKTFGLHPLDDQATWLARLLGISNITLGTMFLSKDTQELARTHRLGLLAANAGVTVVAAAQGRLPKRTAVSVLAFIGALLPAALQE